MRRHSIFAIIAGSLAVPTYGPTELNCGAGDVRVTLDSMVRERVIRVIADSMPSVPRVEGGPAPAATRVSIRGSRPIEWESVEGWIKCTADVVVEAPEGFRGPVHPTRTELRYRVMSNNADTFLVEIAYADLMNAFTLHSPAARDVAATP